MNAENQVAIIGQLLNGVVGEFVKVIISALGEATAVVLHPGQGQDEIALSSSILADETVMVEREWVHPIHKRSVKSELVNNGRRMNDSSDGVSAQRLRVSTIGKRILTAMD